MGPSDTSPNRILDSYLRGVPVDNSLKSGAQAKSRSRIKDWLQQQFETEQESETTAAKDTELNPTDGGHRGPASAGSLPLLGLVTTARAEEDMENQTSSPNATAPGSHQRSASACLLPSSESISTRRAEETKGS